ncbi:glycoside hydrolase family 31 protein [Olivibacter sp. CPCC 100613]|uniref:hypothetical protein n=1 Tax=Olivibacter sp. CPCC 100613 TaxID=3079931 RepID=UPI002FF7C1A2
MKSKIFALLFCCIYCYVEATDLPDTLFIKKNQYTFFLLSKGLRYGVQLRGESSISPHPLSGVCFVKGVNKSPLISNAIVVLKQNENECQLEVENEEGTRARLSVLLFPDYISIKLDSCEGKSTDTLFTIDFCTAATKPGYGLGDHGGYGESTAIDHFIDNDFGNRDNEHRFISTFTFFPSNKFAQVLFEKRTKRIAITDRENRLGATGVQKATVYYFLGETKLIYSNYKQIKIREGYPDVKPKYRFFKLGYEAFGSLGWNTFQQSVQEDIDHYLQHGFELKWGVVGSGFWKGERRGPNEGSTTSFGIWDNEPQAGRRDGLPSPRYPYVSGFKEFFNKRNIDLLLGLRINFKATQEFHGNYCERNDGLYTRQGLDSNYFVAVDDAKKPSTFRVNFPQGNVFLLNSENKKAIDWYVRGVDKWGVKGFKEDLMLLDGAKLNNDAKADDVNRSLMKKGYLIMARNGAYAVPGDILRLEDTQYGYDQDRPIINGLNYAASGVAAVYLDIVAGKYLKLPLTDDQEIYFVRNAMLAAVSPVMAMGLGPWHITKSHYREAVKKAADWHAEYAIYLYNAAIKSFHEGFPYTMTPLPIAFSQDTNTYYLAGKMHKQYSWMLGESLLAAPLYGNDYATATSRNVYLPAGRWIDYEKGTAFNGPCILPNYELPVDKLPLFIGGKGVLVREQNQEFYADIYPVSKDPFTYECYFPASDEKTIIHKKTEGVLHEHIKVTDLNTNEEFKLKLKKGDKCNSFRLMPGHQYEIENENK